MSDKNENIEKVPDIIKLPTGNYLIEVDIGDGKRERTAYINTDIIITPMPKNGIRVNMGIFTPEEK